MTPRLYRNRIRQQHLMHSTHHHTTLLPKWRLFLLGAVALLPPRGSFERLTMRQSLLTQDFDY